MCGPFRTIDVYEQTIISMAIIHVLKEQNHFWEKVHKLWVNGYLFWEI